MGTHHWLYVYVGAFGCMAGASLSPLLREKEEGKTFKLRLHIGKYMVRMPIRSFRIKGKRMKGEMLTHPCRTWPATTTHTHISNDRPNVYSCVAVTGNVCVCTIAYYHIYMRRYKKGRINWRWRPRDRCFLVCFFYGILYTCRYSSEATIIGFFVCVVIKFYDDFFLLKRKDRRRLTWWQ